MIIYSKKLLIKMNMKFSMWTRCGYRNAPHGKHQRKCTVDLKKHFKLFKNCLVTTMNYVMCSSPWHEQQLILNDRNNPVLKHVLKNSCFSFLTWKLEDCDVLRLFNAPDLGLICNLRASCIFGCTAKLSPWSHFINETYIRSERPY